LIPLLAEDILGLLDLLDIRKCCLVGHSIGGFIALQFALSHRNRLAALVLVDTSSGQFGSDPTYAKVRQKLDELARSQGLEAAFEYDAANNPMRIERFKKHPELREISRQKVLMTSVNGYICGPRAIAKWQPVTPRLSEIRVPTLIFWGDEDTAFTEAVKILEKGIAGSALVTVQGVGHNPHEEAPEVFNQALLKFLERVKW
jgi:pimeloyl-ACP methyl ester carboxylesterase